MSGRTAIDTLLAAIGEFEEAQREISHGPTENPAWTDMKIEGGLTLLRSLRDELVPVGRTIYDGLPEPTSIAEIARQVEGISRNLVLDAYEAPVPKDAPLWAASERLLVLVEYLRKLDFPLVEVRQHDWIPGFAAFLARPDGTVDPEPRGPAHIVLNLGAILGAVRAADVEPEEVPYFVAGSLMHEIVHVFEEWAVVEFSEDRVEALLGAYEREFRDGPEVEIVSAEDLVVEILKAAGRDPEATNPAFRTGVAKVLTKLGIPGAEEVE